MGENNKIVAAMQQRLEEMRILLAAAQMGSQRAPQEWIAECVAATGALLDQTSNVDQKFGVLAALAWAMWQKGYEAAPKLEWILPEGAEG